MINTHEQVKKFIVTLQKEYPHLKVDYDYDAEEDYYYINHNSKNLQFNNEEFPWLAGKLIRTLFYEQGIFNISFGYDYSYYKDINNYKMPNYEHISINFNKSAFTTNSFYKQPQTLNMPLIINNTDNIKFSLDVTDSLKPLNNRQAYSISQDINSTYYDSELRLVS